MRAELDIKKGSSLSKRTKSEWAQTLILEITCARDEVYGTACESQNSAEYIKPTITTSLLRPNKLLSTKQSASAQLRLGELYT